MGASGKPEAMQKKTDVVLASDIIRSSLNNIFSCSLDLSITECNDRGAQTLGYLRAELLSKQMGKIIKDVKAFDKIIAHVNEKDRYEGETVLIDKKGESHEVFIGVSPLRTSSGEKVGYLCSFRDNAELKAWQMKVTVKDERYIDLFENASDLIHGVDKSGRFIYTNRSWSKCLGYSKKDLQSIRIFDLIDPPELKQFKASFSKAFSGHTGVSQVWKLRTKKGKTLLVESRDNLKYEEGKPQILRSIMRDMTSTAAAEQLALEQAAKIQAIFDNGKIMLWTVNRKTELTSFNQEYSDTIKNLYGKSPKITLDDSTPKDKFASDAYHNFWEKKYKEVFRSGKNAFFQTKTKDPSGKIFHREIYLRPIHTGKDKSKVTEVAGMGVDVTEKKQTERIMNEQSEKIKIIFNAANRMIWSLDIDGKLTSFNDVFKNKLKERFEVDVNLGMDGVKIGREIGVSFNGGWKTLLRRLSEKSKLQYEAVVTDKDGKAHIEDVALSAIYNEDGEVWEVACLSQTVTFKKVAERKLKEQAAKINAIFDSTAMLIWTVDKDMRIVSFNKTFADNHYHLLGSYVGIGNNFITTLGNSVKDESIVKLKRFYELACTGTRQQFEGVLMGKDGEKRWMETFLSPIFKEGGEVSEISCLTYEITDKKQIEEQMRSSISEKEILLQEVHHRVKNNLQVISSILNLQTSYVKDENSLNILRESQNRIKSMSFIHESLYQTGDFSHIEFSSYMLALCKNLVHSYAIHSDTVELKTELTKTFLSLDQAIPSGLIANELISNALKYAFEEGTKGEIYMGISDQDNQIRLEIGDNGRGLPEGLDHKNSDSLGLQLVHTLVDQLDAEIHVDLKGGTKYLITFDKQ